jgi:hypothetical protein
LTALLVGLALNGMIAFATADEFSDAERLLKQGQSSEALEKVDSYIAGRPKEARGRFLKGLILIEMGQPTEAMAVFSALSEDYPELPEPYNNLAVVYAQQKQYEKARTALEMAIRTDPGYALARENLGDVYARLASQAYDQALQLDPSNKVTQSKLSRLREPGSSVSVSPGKQADAARPSSGGTGKTGAAAQARGTAATPAGAAAAKPVDKVTAADAPAAQARVQDAAARSDAPKTTPSMTTSQGPVATAPPNETTVQGWDLIFSPYTVHFNPDKDHKPVVAIGLLKGLEGHWLAGGRRVLELVRPTECLRLRRPALPGSVRLRKLVPAMDRRPSLWLRRRIRGQGAAELQGLLAGHRTQPRLPLQQENLWPARSARRVGADVHHRGAVAEGLALSTASAVVGSDHQGQ